LVLSTTSQCVCQNSRSDDPPTPRAADTAKPATTKPDAAGSIEPAPVRLPGSVKTSDLDSDERAIVVGVLTEQFDPCGKPRSFMESLQDEKPCSRAVSLANLVVVLVSKGLSKRQVTAEYLRELKRTTTKAEIALDGAPVFGSPETATHVLVEFTDFQCPYCKAAAHALKEMAKKHKAVLYIKHFPLDVHTQSRLAAQAAVAAHRQSKFWELSDLLFANQDRLDEKVIRELAAEVGLDLTRFDQDWKSEEAKAAVERDLAEGERHQVDGTPSVFLDGFLIEIDNLEDRLAGQ
jgi:protein-disulfide isomerase